MATILEFTGAGRGDDRGSGEADHAAATDNTATAQIIFFPGIRIERYDIDPFLEDGDAQDRSSKSSA